MKKYLMILLAACLTLTACGPKLSGEKIEYKDASEYETEAEDTADDDYSIATEGEAAPDITLTAFDGTEKKLSDYYGKPTVINFWATWCGYCIMEMPAFQKLCDSYGDDINVIALNCGDSAEDAEAYMQSTDYTFEAVTVSAEDSFKFGAESIPVTVIIDKDGIVQFYKLGGGDSDEVFEYELAPVIDELLGK